METAITIYDVTELLPKSLTWEAYGANTRCMIYYTPATKYFNIVNHGDDSYSLTYCRRIDGNYTPCLINAEWDEVITKIKDSVRRSDFADALAMSVKTRIAYCPGCNAAKHGVKSRIAIEHTCGK